MLTPAVVLAVTLETEREREREREYLAPKPLSNYQVFFHFA